MGERKGERDDKKGVVYMGGEYKERNRKEK